MIAVASVLFGLNAAVSKVILSSGITSLRLTEVRSLGALIGFAAVALATRPGSLAASPRELGFFAVFGIAGVTCIQLFYFLAIHRLQIGVALLLQYTAPLVVALWAWLVAKEALRRRIWAALVLALGGLSLVVDLWSGVSLDGLGVAFGFLAAVAYA